MVYLIILVSITLIGLIFATITDLRTREVPDLLSYGLMVTGLGLNLLFSLAYSNYWYFINSAVGLLIFLGVALVMFYTGQWGGGDSKVLMGLGALIGFDVRFTGFPFLVNFLVNILLVGAVYGLVWSMFLAFRNWAPFSKEFRKTSHSQRVIKSRTYFIIFAFLMMVLAVFMRGTLISSFFLTLLLIGLVTFYLWIFVKAIEKTCMVKKVAPDTLTEGDWIVKEIKYQGKYICGPKDLGIEKKQILRLRNLYKENRIGKVLIKEGIPFVPSFLIAYILSLFWSNLLILLI